jgi:hypothetical protein
MKYECDDQLSIYDLDAFAMDMERYVYVWVDNTIYELPLCVCDSVEELADKTGDSIANINDLISKAEKRQGKSKYIRVRI